MARADRHSYRFRRSEHWAICGRDGFAHDGDVLTVGGGGVWQALGVEGKPPPLALAAGSRGEFLWLRRSGELLSSADGALGVLDLRENGKATHGDSETAWLAFDDNRIWLVVGGSLAIYHRVYLQQLSQRQNSSGTARALAVDRSGAWCLIAGNGGNCHWLHLDGSGVADRPQIPCPPDVSPLAGALDPCSGRLLTVDEQAVRGRDPCAAEWTVEVDLRPYRCWFEPDRIAVDCKGIVHLFDRKRGAIWSFAEGGIRVGQRDVPIERSEQEHDTPTPGSLIAAAETIIVASNAGIFQLIEPSNATPEAIESGTREAVLLTPTLTSPLDPGGGWQRAQVTADLTPGTTLEIRVAFTDDQRLKDRVAGIASQAELSATQRLMAIEVLLPWDECFLTVLAPTDDPLGLGSFDILLDGITAPYLWLALQLHVPPTSRPAKLRELEVRYPERSWIEDLPAVYRAEPVRAAELRRFLAVTETVFDRLEETIESLPERLTPANPDEKWLDFLLRWLGLPLPIGIPAKRKQELLTEAAVLLHRRGTLWALDRALRIVTGRTVRVVDHGAGPLPWVLGVKGTELGRSTLVTRQERLGFALGHDARLGRDGLGRYASFVTDRVAQRTQMLRIEIDGTARDDGATAAGIESVLDHFLPAACRYELSLMPEGVWIQGRRLDRDARLAAPGNTAVGRGHELGHTALARTRPPEVRLDHRAPLDGGHRLS